jgi:hypothetical protein
LPLNRSCSIEALRANISTEIRAGRSPAQATAIAFQVLREACKAAGKSVPKTDGQDRGIQVLRYDEGQISGVTRTPNGYLGCDARITRVGVFSYRQADGTVRKELRLPEDVFRSDALRSFEDVPLTNGHPPRHEPLNPKNTRRWQAGSLRNIRQDDQFVGARVLITDEDAIKAAEAGKTQVSCGYNCDLDFTPGTTAGIAGVADGLRYDAIQRNIVGNHVALVEKGRAGPETSLHLDAEDAVMITDQEPHEPAGPVPGPEPRGIAMKILRIDGVDFELTEQAAQAVEKLRARLDTAMEANEGLKKQVSQEQARADKAEEGLAAEQKARKEDSSEAKIQEAVRARVALETVARDILKEDEDKLDLETMGETEIRKLVILKVCPSAKERLDGAKESYVQARFDGAVDTWKAQKADADPSDEEPRRTRTVPVSTTKTDSLSARERMIQHHCNLGRSPIKPPTLDEVR